MGALLRRSLEQASVVRFGTYDYFVHPLTDGIPAISPDLLREVAAEVRAVADLDVDKIVTVEAMGIPVAAALSLETGLPLVVVRKRQYRLPGELTVDQATGYGKGALYLNGLARGDRILFLDDVVSTGGTLDPLLRAFRAAGVDVRDVVVVVEKGDGRARIEREHGVRVKTLVRVEVRDGRVHVV